MITITKGIFAGFLLGTVVGGAIALLTAPKSGKHLRNDISRKTNELIEDGKKNAYESWNGVKGRTESTIESANDMLNNGKEKIMRKAEKVKDAYKAGINAYNNGRKDESDERISSEDESITYGKIT